MAAKPAPPVKKLVVLEEGGIISLANQPQVLKEFPFLKNLKQQAIKKTSVGCSSCGGNRAINSAYATALQSAKQNLAGMGDDKKRKLKKFLNTQKIRITYKQGKRIVQHTF